MQSQRLLTRLLQFFSRSHQRQEEKRKQLKTLLKKLKKEERLLREALDAAPDTSALDTTTALTPDGVPPVDAAQVQRQWAVLREQRKKGVALLRSLKKT
jgi:hypothetical protein